MWLAGNTNTSPNSPAWNCRLLTFVVPPSPQADLCGLKWRRLSSEQQGPSLGGGGPHRGGGGGAADPLSEPVLSSFAKCLAADLLCVWRRVARPELPHRRELWVFWYGEEPDLAGLVSPELNGEWSLASRSALIIPAGRPDPVSVGRIGVPGTPLRRVRLLRLRLWSLDF